MQQPCFRQQPRFGDSRNDTEMDDLVDSELLMMPIEWLENQNTHLGSQLENLSRELAQIKIALEIKRRIQDENVVPTRIISVDGIEIKLLPLPTAVAEVNKNRGIRAEVHNANIEDNLSVWRDDGYDVDCVIGALLSRAAGR